MTFWEAIAELRRTEKIPKQWTVSSIRPHLAKRFSEGTILSVPMNQSITVNGQVMGSLVKKGRKPKAFRVALGLFELIDDPGAHVSASD
jgi:hypothetical protein